MTQSHNNVVGGIIESMHEDLGTIAKRLDDHRTAMLVIGLMVLVFTIGLTIPVASLLHRVSVLEKEVKTLRDGRGNIQPDSPIRSGEDRANQEASPL